MEELDCGNAFVAGAGDAVAVDDANDLVVKVVLDGRCAVLGVRLGLEYHSDALLAC